MKVLLAVNESNDVERIEKYLSKRFGDSGFDLDILTVLQADSNVLGQLGRLAPNTQAEMDSYNAACTLVSEYGQRLGKACKVKNLRTHVEYGEPAEVILGFSRRAGADHLMIGAPEREGMLTAFRMDGITRRLLKWSDCPVEICKPLDDGNVEFRIMVPLAMDTTQASGLPDLSAYHWPMRSHIHFLGIVPPPFDDCAFEASGAAVLLKIQEGSDAQARAKARLQKFSRETALRLPEGVKTSHEIVEGEPRDLTVRSARALEPDLIVLTEGWEGDTVPSPFSALAPVSLTLSAPCSVLSMSDRPQVQEDLAPVANASGLAHSR